MDLDVHGGRKEKMKSLKNNASSGVKWTATSQFGRNGLQLVSTIILARLLAPSDFGLIGMATVVIGFGALFKDLGTSAAVIQRKNLTEELVSSIFWMNAAFGFLVMVSISLASPLVAAFYQEARVEPILKLLSVTFFISGLSILQQAILERELEFRKLSLVEISATLVGSLVGIGSALNGYGVWSLVYQTLATASATTVMLWTASRWRPKPLCRWDEVKSVRSYSLNLTGFNVFNYFVRNADYLLIGRYLGARDLGFYTLAYQIMLIPLHSISAVVGRVMFPLYSQMQEDTARFRSAYLKVAGAIALITFPMMFGLWAVVEPFILTLFGPPWKPVISLLMILAPVGLIQSIGTTVGGIYQARGRTDWMFRWGVAAGVIYLLAFIIGLRWGIVGVAVAYAITSLMLTYPNFAIPFTLIDLPIRNFSEVLWRPFVACLIMFAGILALKIILPPDLTGNWVLAVLVPVGGLIYLATNWLMNRNQVMELIGIVGGQQ
jgi:PST family polysaccharide transporter